MICVPETMTNDLLRSLGRCENDGNGESQFFHKRTPGWRTVDSGSKNVDGNVTLRSAAGILEEPEIVEGSAQDTHHIIAHAYATAFKRDLAAKCVAAGMWLSTAPMWDAVANALQATLLIDYLRAEIKSCDVARDSESLVQRALGIDAHGS
jgi:hypothetical protein